MANELANNLIHYYAFTANANDSVAGGTNATVNGATFSAGGIIGNCYDFDGVNNTITIGSAASPANLNFAITDSYTVSIWVNADTITGITGKFIGIAGSYFRHGIAIQVPTCRIQFGMRSSTVNGSKVSDTSISTGEWTHLAVSHNATNRIVTLYKNGINVDSKDVSAVTGDTSNTAAWNMGYSILGGNRLYFDGKMDEFSIWNRLLTDNEIEAVYNKGIGRTYPYPTGWPNKLNNVTNAMIGKINGISKYDITKINKRV
jgi:hypothetical protein